MVLWLGLTLQVVWYGHKKSYFWGLLVSMVGSTLWMVGTNQFDYQKGRLRWLGHVQHKHDSDRIKCYITMAIDGTRWRDLLESCIKVDMKSLGLSQKNAQSRNTWWRRTKGEEQLDNLSSAEKMPIKMACLWHVTVSFRLCIALFIFLLLLSAFIENKCVHYNRIEILLQIWLLKAFLWNYIPYNINASLKVFCIYP